MSEAFVNLTEGSGKKVHFFDRSIGANTVLDQVTLLGENYLASYIGNGTSVVSVSVATANSHIFQVMAGSSLKVRIRRIEVYQVAMATTATMCQFILTRLSTAGSGGTVNGVSSLDAGDPGSGATLMTLPTAKGTEIVTMWSGTAYFAQTQSASTPLTQPILTIDFDRPRSKPLIIGAGTSNGIALKNQGAVAGATVQFSIWLDESSF